MILFRIFTLVVEKKKIFKRRRKWFSVFWEIPFAKSCHCGNETLSVTGLCSFSSNFFLFVETDFILFLFFPSKYGDPSTVLKSFLQQKEKIPEFESFDIISQVISFPLVRNNRSSSFFLFSQKNVLIGKKYFLLLKNKFSNRRTKFLLPRILF
jgi:hypothetical protein